MRRRIFKYLKSYSTQPFEIDRLIVSAFIKKNHLHVSKNKLLKNYIIDEAEISEYDKLQKFILLLKEEFQTFDVEHLIELFEFVISPSDRIVNGVVYTPYRIREFITNQLFCVKTDSVSTVKVVDLACGCGGFLYNAAKLIRSKTSKSFKEIYEKQIFGLDIQDYATKRTKLILSLLAISEGEDIGAYKFNLFTGDALVFDWTKALRNFTGFEIVLGNPPYVCSRKLTGETKMLLKKWEVSNSGHPDLYIPFFQIGVEILSLNGVLGFITMNSFFKSLNGRKLREYFQRKSFEFRIIDFATEQIFKSRNTYTCICFIENKTNSGLKYFRSCDSFHLLNESITFSNIEYKNLKAKSGWNLYNHEIISKIESTGSPFGKIYRTRNGIATLKNSIYIFDPVKEDKKYYYLRNGSEFPIEKEICRDILNSNRLNSPGTLRKYKEKIIFPYTNDVKPRLFDEVFFKKNFPEAYNYLKSKKHLLDERDNGEGEYENWFAFGRTQSLERVKYKLFFPHLADKSPHFLINSDENLLFYNGLAVIGQSKEELMIVKKIMESKVFWFYVQNTSKPYTSGYFSFSSNYIRDFGVCDLNKQEISFLIATNDRNALDAFFERKYKIRLP